MFRLPSGKIFKDEIAATAIHLLILKHGGIKESTSNRLILKDGYYIEYIEDKSSVETIIDWKYNPSKIEYKVEDTDFTDYEKEVLKNNKF